MPGDRVAQVPSLEVSIADSAAALARTVDVQALFAEATQASVRAHVPHSDLRVGAVLLTSSGETVTGVNVENASYGLTICAERSAVVRAVAEGHTQFRAIAVGGDTDQVDTLASCGACLQVLSEFDSDERLLVAFPEGPTLRVTRLIDLLPVRFRLPPGPHEHR
jgi:cytidine deaminase